MKIVFYLAIIVAGFVGVNYVSKYMMGGIESGIPGNKGLYKEYHEGNLFADYLKGMGKEKKKSYAPVDAPAVSTNPFAE